MKKLENRSAASAYCFWICLVTPQVTCKRKIVTTLADSEKVTITKNSGYSVCDFKYILCLNKRPKIGSTKIHEYYRYLEVYQMCEDDLWPEDDLATEILSGW